MMRITHDSLYVHVPIDDFVEFIEDLNGDVNIHEKYSNIFNILPKLQRYVKSSKTKTNSSNPCGEVWLDEKPKPNTLQNLYYDEKKNIC